MNWQRAKARKSTSALFCVLSLTAMLHGCTTPTKVDKDADDTQARLSEEEKKKLDELKAEAEIGRNIAGRLLQVYGVVDDEGLVGYVNQVGDYVASYSDYPERRYMFAIINDEEVNAFACPGGYILITMGALRHARNEAELGHVLGHEITHVGKKHMFNRLTSMSKEQLEQEAKELELKQHLPKAVLVRERPTPEDNQVGSLMARYLSGSAAGLSVLTAAKAGMSIIMEKGLGADLEFDADHEGVRFAIRAGYQPNALNQFLCRLEMSKFGPVNRDGFCKLKKGSTLVAEEGEKTILEKTHPPIPQRIKHIRKLLSEMDARKIIGALGKNRYDEFHAKLPKKEGH